MKNLILLIICTYNFSAYSETFTPESETTEKPDTQNNMQEASSDTFTSYSDNEEYQNSYTEMQSVPYDEFTEHAEDNNTSNNATMTIIDCNGESDCNITELTNNETSDSTTPPEYNNTASNNTASNDNNFQPIGPSKLETLLISGIDCETIKQEIPNLREEIESIVHFNPLTLVFGNPDLINCLLNNGAKVDQEEYVVSSMDGQLTKRSTDDSLQLTIEACNNGNFEKLGYRPDEVQPDFFKQICESAKLTMDTIDEWKEQNKDSSSRNTEKSSDSYTNGGNIEFFKEASGTAKNEYIYAHNKTNKANYDDRNTKQDKNKYKYSCNNNKFRDILDIIMAIHCGTVNNFNKIIKSIPEKTRTKTLKANYMGFPLISFAIQKANFRNNEDSLKKIDILISNGVIDSEPDKTIALYFSVTPVYPIPALVSKIMKKGANPNYSLMIAAKFGNIFAVKNLVFAMNELTKKEFSQTFPQTNKQKENNNNANPNFIKYNQTPLGLAAQYGNYHTVDYFLNSTNINQSNLKTVIKEYNKKRNRFCLYYPENINSICNRYPKYDRQTCRTNLNEYYQDCINAIRKIKNHSN